MQIPKALGALFALYICSTGEEEIEIEREHGGFSSCTRLLEGPRLLRTNLTCHCHVLDCHIAQHRSLPLLAMVVVHLLDEINR